MRFSQIALALIAGLLVVGTSSSAFAAGPGDDEEGPSSKGDTGDSGSGSEAKPKKKSGRFGLGLLLGNPSALSAKYFIRPKHAIQAAAGYAFLMRPDGAGSNGSFRFHLDYAWHPGAIAGNNVFDLLPYIGLGVGSGFFMARQVAPGGTAAVRRVRPLAFLRLPVLGLSFHWQRVPMDTALELSWTPAMVWLPSPQGELRFADFVLAIRYYF